MKKLLLSILMSFVLVCALHAEEPGHTWENEFPEGLTDAAQSQLPASSLDGRLIGLYFSASWCRGCLVFSRILVPFRNQHQDRFEVVLVGFDYDSAGMHEYMNNYGMEWPAIPYDSPARLAIKERFGISEIPTLIIMGPDGKVLTLTGHQDVENLGDAAIEHWQRLAETTK